MADFMGDFPAELNEPVDAPWPEGAVPNHKGEPCMLPPWAGHDGRMRQHWIRRKNGVVVVWKLSATCRSWYDEDGRWMTPHAAWTMGYRYVGRALPPGVTDPDWPGPFNVTAEPGEYVKKNVEPMETTDGRD